jgi:hypothetical protein
MTGRSNGKKSLLEGSENNIILEMVQSGNSIAIFTVCKDVHLVSCAEAQKPARTVVQQWYSCSQ